MLIACPSCATRFAVPDSALGQKGRTLKCARCGHKWYQTAAADASAAPSDAAAEAAPAAGQLLPGFEGFTLSDSPSLDERAGDTPAPAPFSLAGESMPEALGARAPRRTQEAAGRGQGATLMWVLLVVLILLGAGAYGVFAFQDRLVALWPPAAEYLDTLGLRRETAGAGLTFRDSNSERVMQGDRENLVVRGVIANVTEQPRDVPLMRLALFDDRTLVQDKVVRPPVDRLDGGATAAFRIVLEQPHPTATRFEVTFTDTVNTAN